MVNIINGEKMLSNVFILIVDGVHLPMEKKGMKNWTIKLLTT